MESTLLIVNHVLFATKEYHRPEGHYGKILKVYGKRLNIGFYLGNDE